MAALKHCIRCGQEYTPRLWARLPLLDVLVLPIVDAFLPRPMRQEWRRCLCGNSIQIDTCDPEYATYAPYAPPLEEQAMTP